MKRYELVEGGSSKFWEVSAQGKQLVVRFGRIGTKGQTQEKTFDTEAKANAERDKLTREKTKKGYKVVVPASDDERPAAAESAEQPEISLAPAVDPAATVTDTEPATAARSKGKGKSQADAKPQGERGWLDAGAGYALALEAGKIKCRNAKGQVLASVPKELKEGGAFEQLDNLREFLAAHDRECSAQVESWMLRSLPTPRAVLSAVWPDPAWRRALENAVVVPTGDPGAGGFFKAVDAARGIGIVDRDGETVWLTTESVSILHPIALEGLDDLRGLATELGLVQGVAQLFREVFHKKANLDATATNISELSGGVFKQLNHAFSLCKKHGFRVSGGSAVTKIWELDDTDKLTAQEARYWLGADDPTVQAYTGDLVWVDERERPIPLGKVGRVAFSEGMRLASTIHAGRVVEQEAHSA